MTTPVATLLHALHCDPGDETAWLALADALEECGQPERAELTRLMRRLRSLPPGPQSEVAQQRVQDLLQRGVLPCIPEIINSIGMRFALIPAGVFAMGSHQGETDRSEDEGPVHEVQITRPFYLAVHQVTQEQYQQVMGSNPSYFSSTAGG